MPTVNSTAIAAIDYNEETQEMFVTFHRGGRGYALQGVPAIEYERFLNSTSKGSYWNTNLKGKY
jgi:hypothetical protein